jgi:hypothetical protein
VTGQHFPHESLASHEERADRVLGAAGFKFDGRSGQAGRLTEDCNLKPEIYEALRLKLLARNVKTFFNLQSYILRKTAEAGRPVKGFENVSRLTGLLNDISGEIGRLGERIKAREREQIAQLGQTKLLNLRNMWEARTKKQDAKRTLWVGTIRRLLKTHPQWKDLHVAQEALKNPPKALHPGKKSGDGSLGALRRYVKEIREEIRA